MTRLLVKLVEEIGPETIEGCYKSCAQATNLTDTTFLLCPGLKIGH